MFRAMGGALNGNVGVMRTMISEIIKEKKYAVHCTRHSQAEFVKGSSLVRSYYSRCALTLVGEVMEHRKLD